MTPLLRRCSLIPRVPQDANDIVCSTSASDVTVNTASFQTLSPARRRDKMYATDEELQSFTRARYTVCAGALSLK